jgi:pyrroloquinoline quinone (PQQ) biosynthesis protein C
MMRQQETNYARLLRETAREREAFLSIPLIGRTLAGESDRGLYLRFLEQAYHHVRHTCPLMGAALARCHPDDLRLREALIEYLEEEKGHELWILEDIEALGGDAEAARASGGEAPVRVMTGYAYYAIEHISPYALLGMVHVLEGMSVLLAERAARSIASAIAADGDAPAKDKGAAGFSYLRSHGALDKEHVDFYETLINSIEDKEALAAIIDCAAITYRLYGDIFRALDQEPARELRHAS